VRGEVAAPRTRAQRRALALLTEQVFAAGEPRSARVPTHEIDELMLLSSWFRTRPQELKRTRKPPAG
jgi:excinuclease ABC subunit C